MMVPAYWPRALMRGQQDEVLDSMLLVGPCQQYANFGISLPARSADALPAILHGHSPWRPLSCAER